jgi:hypothetical protein
VCVRDSRQGRQAKGKRKNTKREKEKRTLLLKEGGETANAAEKKALRANRRKGTEMDLRKKIKGGGIVRRAMHVAASDACAGEQRRPNCLRT